MLASQFSTNAGSSYVTGRAALVWADMEPGGQRAHLEFCLELGETTSEHEYLLSFGCVLLHPVAGIRIQLRALYEVT